MCIKFYESCGLSPTLDVPQLVSKLSLIYTLSRILGIKSLGFNPTLNALGLGV